MSGTGNGTAGFPRRFPWWMILYDRRHVTEGPNAFALDFASLVHCNTGPMGRCVLLYTDEQTARSMALPEGSPSVQFPDMKDKAVAAETLRMLMFRGVTHVAFDVREVTGEFRAWRIEEVIRDLEA